MFLSINKYTHFYFKSFFLILVIALSHSLLNAQIVEKAPRRQAITLKQAQAWCDTTAIHNPEGIYIHPSSGSTVLVKATGSRKQTWPSLYEIINIESNNLYIAPGQVIGYLTPTADPAEFTLTIYEKFELDLISNPKDYTAKFQANLASITYNKPTKRISFNPLALIPKLNRLFRISTSTPKTACEGFTRIYPINLSSPAYSRRLPLYY